MQTNKIPTISDIENFLQEYGWKYRKVNAGENFEKEVLIAPFKVSADKGVLVSFRPEGEFLMVSTVDFISNVKPENLIDFFHLNDTIKLVKLFLVSKEPLCLEAGFELWSEAIKKETFFAFMDMLCITIEELHEKQSKKELDFATHFVNLQ